MDDALREAVEVFKRESVAVLHAQKDAVYFKPFITCASKIKGVHYSFYLLSFSLSLFHPVL